ncbi:MAG TPA: hypothetical protein VGL37_07230 [Solirubrobacteraceae bacterium]|jgi:hypothetical protein
MRLRLLAPAALAALALAGCGAARTVRLPSHELKLALSEYRIEPSSTSVPPGPLLIVARNRGILTHNVELERGSLDSNERTVLATIHTLLPGASEAKRTPPLAPGRYLLVSTIDDQTTLGMSATLIVR